MKFNFVYITTNLINGKQYVGDHSTDDLNCAYTKRYRGGGTILKNAIKKYERKNFNREILDFFPTKQEAFDAQEKYIIQFNTLVPNGYNISPKGGCKAKGSVSEDTKKKHSEMMKGKKKPPRSKEHQQKLNEANRGRHHTKEAREKIRKSSLGKKMSAEAIIKIKEKRKNQIFSIESRTKMKLSQQKRRELERSLGIIKNKKPKNQKYICEYCGMINSGGNYNRWHGEKCKHRYR